MNDSDLEDQLRALSPVAPSADLAARIGRQLAATASSVPTAGVIARPARTVFTLRWWGNLGWAGAGAAAALAGVLFFSTAQKAVTPPIVASTEPQPQPVANVEPVPEDQAFEPAETSRELIAVNKSNELLETEDGTVREVRYTYLERLAWAHPGTGARLEIEVPREDVYLMPVSLQ
jgi:hypothetical protein